MRIALDLDGVLADLHGTMTKHTRYGPDDFQQFGGWDDYDHFWTEARRVWHKHWHEIEPVEPHLEHKVAQLADNHTVDIVTSTAAEDRYAKAWLSKQNIEFERFVRPPEDGYKDALDYDAFIDDNPHLTGDVPVQYLRDQQWNDTFRGDGEYLYHSYEPSYVESEGVLKADPYASSAPWVIRVTGLNDVIRDLNTDTESPCIDICELNDDGTRCCACGQTIEELMR